MNKDIKIEYLDNDVISFVGHPYLFLRQHNSQQHQFQYFTGEKTLSNVAKEQFRRNIEFNQDYCRINGIKYAHLVFPAKIPVFREWFKRAGVVVKPIFGSEHTSAHVMYPLEALNPTEDFLVQDTHNNDCGKLVLMNMLFQQLGLPTFSERPNWVTVDVVGDMGKRLGHEGYNERRMKGFVGQTSKIFTFSTAAALSGNSGQIYFTYNPSAASKKRMVLFGDSFIHSCIHLLAHRFEEVIYFRSPFILPDIADNLAPDIIVTSNAERYLVAVADAKVKKPYFLHYFTDAFSPQQFIPKHREALIALFAGRESNIYLQWKRQQHIKIKNQAL